MINSSILNIEIKRKYIGIYNIFKIILVLSLVILLINKCFANDDDSKKCIVYRNGKLMYNPDNPKIHCTTLQILDNFWDDNNTNTPNPNKKPEDFTEILTLKDITSNGNMVCKNPSTPNATFTTKDALEGETILGTCNTGYTGTVSATCNKNGNWDFSNNCFSDCNDLEDMYADGSFFEKIDKISNSEFAFSECDIGYYGYKKYECKDGKLEETNQCILNTNYCQKLTSVENGSITYNNSQTINSIATLQCDTGYKVNGNKSIICNTDNKTNGKWNDVLGNCTKNTTYCKEITRSGTITYTDDQTIGSVATLTCSGNYDIFGEKEVKCITDETNKDNDTGKWDKELGDCGVVIQYYSPRNNVVKEKTIKKGETFKCEKVVFTENDPEPFVMKLCRVKGSDKYFGFESDGATYTLNDTLFTKQSSACHIAYANRDLNTDKLKKDYGLNGETKLYNGTLVYDAGDNSGGLRQNGGKYIINCIDGYAGKPEIVCNNGKWTWTPDKDNKTDNQCYKGGCDIDTLPVAGRNIKSEGYRLDASLYDNTQRIARNNDWVAASCEDGFVSNQDTENPKMLNAICKNGEFVRTDDGGIKHGDTCVKGCAYGDTDMGWTNEMMKNTTGDYAQHNSGNGAVNVGKYAVRLTNVGDALIYKKCTTGSSVDNSSQAYPNVSYPLVQCNYETGKWSQHIGYKMGCTK